MLVDCSIFQMVYLKSKNKPECKKISDYKMYAISRLVDNLFIE